MSEVIHYEFKPGNHSCGGCGKTEHQENIITIGAIKICWSCIDLLNDAKDKLNHGR